MSTILEKIITQKRLEVARQKELVPTRLLEKSARFELPTASLRHHLTRPESAGIIAEIKRQSPSKGIINGSVDVKKLAVGYLEAGASALSILTDGPFFGGSIDDILAARPLVDCPILRKEFIVDEYQIIEAKSIGADAILLLANVLDPLKIRQFAALARSLGMEILLEIHDETELESICPEVSCVGVNNRNLKDFSVSLDHSFRLGELIPAAFLKVSESGLRDARTILSLREAGFRGFLIGEFFMKHAAPEAVCRQLIDDLKRLQLVENQLIES